MDGTAAENARPITYARVTALAVPIVLSNAAVPLQSAVDVAIVGNTGDTTLMAAIALGAAAVVLVLTSFNFLQTGLSGTTAQAFGADRPERAVHTLLRGLILAGAIALGLIVLRAPIAAATLLLFEGSAEAEAAAAGYIAVRFWGAPFELGNYALMGWFAGQGRTRRLFEIQLAVSLVNVTATLAFVLGLGLGLEGVALGTATGHAAAFAYGAWRARQRAREVLPAGWRPDPARVARAEEIAALMRLNRDIFVRTLLLTFSFAWVARLGSIQGDRILAANGVLWEFFYVSAAALDGFAIAAESLVGRAIGQGSRERLRASVRVASTACLGLAAAISLGLLALSGPIVDLFTDVEAVRETARTYAFWAAFTPLVGAFAFMLDGVFIGAADGRAMRDSMVIAAGLFLPGGWLMTEAFGNHGLWAAVWAFLSLRALTLAARYPRLEARVAVPA